jgi:Big-like domain-containing protein
MAPTQSLSLVPRTFRPDAPLRREWVSGILLIPLILAFASAGLAQGGVPLVTVATDQSSLNLSNQFGVPTGTAVNQAGDFAFVGSGDAALFLRPAGTNSATRLLQIYDEAPGFPGSQILMFLPELSMNSSRVLLFAVRFTGADNFAHAALLTYDGANYHTMATSDGTAPGSNGAAYGLDLIPGSIDDSGDINFAAVPIGVNAATYYIVPSGGQAERIVGLNDTPPAACTWCVAPGGSGGGFFPGLPVGSVILVGVSFVPPLNAQGQMLLSLWGALFIGGKTGSFSLVPMAATGACSPQTIVTGTGSTTVPELTGFLNDSGTVAFTNPSNTGAGAICVVATGAAIADVIDSTSSAPASAGGGTLTSPVALGLDNSGDIVFQSTISGSTLTTFALLRYHPSNGQSDVVAYNCEAAPDVSGSFFSPLPSCASWDPGGIFTLSPTAFSGVSIANGGSVGFIAALTDGGFAVYTQTGTATPQFISPESGASPTIPAGVIKISVSTALFPASGGTEILNNGSVLFSSYLTSGAADFAVFLGTPQNVETLMSTADQLPSGARTLLGGTPPVADGHFVVFTAQPAAGRNNLLESDLTTGAITRVVSDNDPAFAAAGAPSGNTVVGANFFLNGNGQVAFQTVASSAVLGIGVISIGGGSLSSNSTWLDLGSACGTVYLWSPSGGVAKVATAGDAVPNSSATFPCVALNEAYPSPLNQAGDVVFSAPASIVQFLSCLLCWNPSANAVNGDFLHSPSGTISEIAAANDTLPGQSQATTVVPSLSVPVNSTGEVAFGADVGSNASGFFVRNGNAVQEVMAMGDPVPGSSDTFGFPHFLSGLTDSGNLAFTAATGSADEGLFLAPAGEPIQTLALDGGPAPVPGGGTFSLASLPLGFDVGSTGTGTAINHFFQNFAVINDESDVAFDAAITGGSADSGYFRVLQNGPSAGTLQAVVLQGQAAPGGGTFSSIDILAPEFSLGPDGSLAFVNLLTSNALLKQGLFVARPDGTLLKVAASGDPLPGGGTLTAVAMKSKLAAGDSGKFAFRAGVSGGSARSAVFVTAIPPGTASSTATLSPLQSAVAEQPVTLTATVTSAASGNPTGTVAFFDNGISLGTGVLNGGQAALTTSALAAGQASLVAQYDGDSNFAPENSSPLSVVVAGFAPPPTQLTVTPGRSLVIPLTLYAPAGSNMSFSLSCSGLPANSSCMFNVNPVTPGPSGTPVQLTFATIAGSTLPAVPSSKERPSLPGFVLVTLLAVILAVATAPRRRAPRWRLATCAAMLALAMGGCGASSYNSNAPQTPGTPAGNAAVTVTGTSGPATISAVVNITVQ